MVTISCLLRRFGLRVPKTQYCEFMSPFSLNYFQFYTSGVKYMLQTFIYMVWLA
ncbi:hypothetical protein HanPSC8_Chr10g0424431 [Helianthus annuus]|nr:hypothetical protein HanPSC8_Chr10g0424431 [Helianthus annuus]